MGLPPQFATNPIFIRQRLTGSTKGKVTILAHPSQAQQPVEHDTAEKEDIKGKKFFLDLIATATEQGSGGVTCWWPKTGEDAYLARGIYI
ncbi:MAG: hypothetical protein M0Z81_05675 [Deltaproteobacteria bacterium]|nr:hypothetical protein [Deltaproteobacteria bacterium]